MFLTLATAAFFSSPGLKSWQCKAFSRCSPLSQCVCQSHRADERNRLSELAGAPYGPSICCCCQGTCPNKHWDLTQTAYPEEGESKIVKLQKIEAVLSDISRWGWISRSLMVATLTRNYVNIPLRGWEDSVWSASLVEKTKFKTAFFPFWLDALNIAIRDVR